MAAPNVSGWHASHLHDCSDSRALALRVDPELVEYARAGNQDAYAVLINRHLFLVRRISRCYFIIGAAGEDLIQEALIGFVKAVRDYNRDLGSFRAFAELCVKRQVITFIKTQTRQKHQPLNYAISLDAPRFDLNDEPLASYIAADEAPSPSEDDVAFLEELRRRCSQLERRILGMYTQGYSFEEIAAEVGKHWKAIDNAVWRIKVKAKKLRAELGYTSARG